MYNIENSVAEFKSRAEVRHCLLFDNVQDAHNLLH